MQAILSNRLPQPRRGMRRTWTNNGWVYYPAIFPSRWNPRIERLIWDDQTDNWQRIRKHNGSFPVQSLINHVERNLRIRNDYLERQNDNRKLTNIYEKIKEVVGRTDLRNWIIILSRNNYARERLLD